MLCEFHQQQKYWDCWRGKHRSPQGKTSPLSVCYSTFVKLSLKILQHSVWTRLATQWNVGLSVSLYELLIWVLLCVWLRGFRTGWFMPLYDTVTQARPFWHQPGPFSFWALEREHWLGWWLGWLRGGTTDGIAKGMDILALWALAQSWSSLQ